MAEVLETRRRSGFTWFDPQTGVRRYRGTVGPVNRATSLDSGIFDAAIDMTAARINNAQLDGWRVTANGWHYALGIPGTGALAGLDGVVGFGGRQGSHWILNRLVRVGYLHWPTRAWQDVGGAPSYTRTGGRLTQSVNQKTMGDQVLNVEGVASWSNIWTTPGGGDVSLKWRLNGLDLKQDIVLNAAGRNWIAANRPPSTPASETYFGFVFRLDASDIPRWYKGSTQQNLQGDFEDDGSERFALRDAQDRLLAFMPLDYVLSERYVHANGHNYRDRLPLKKRVWRDADGNTYLAVGVLASQLAGFRAGDLIFDPTFTVAETNEDAASSGTDEHTLPSTNDFGTHYVGAFHTPLMQQDFGGIWRATGITQGATINTATITWTRNGDGTGSVVGAMDFFDIDSPTDFNAADAHRVSDHHTRTGSPVTHNFTGSSAAGTRTSPSLVTPLQIVVNRASFGGDIGGCYRSATTDESWEAWQDFTDSAANAADLNVTWTAGTAASRPVFRRSTRFFSRIR